MVDIKSIDRAPPGRVVLSIRRATLEASSSAAAIEVGRPTHLDDDVRALGGGGGANLSSLFRHQDDPSVFFVPARILLALVQDAKVIGLRDANELAVVAFGPHHAPVVQFVHRRRYSKTAVTNNKNRNKQQMMTTAVGRAADKMM